MTSNERESLTETPSPTPLQLWTLANVGIRSAAERGRIKTFSNKDMKRYIFTDETRFDEETDEYGYFAEGFRQFSSSLRVTHAGEKDSRDLKAWSLNIIDSYSMKQEDDGWFKERILYRFRWNRLRSVMAEKAIQIITNDTRTADGSGGVKELGINQIDMEVLAADFSTDIVTLNDCDVLIDDTKRYFSAMSIPKNRNYLAGE